MLAGGAALLCLLAWAEPAAAQAGLEALNGVVNRLRNVLVLLAAGLATLALTYAGVKYLAASGDPEQVGQAKRAVRYAAVGYGLAALAPPLFALLKYIVGG